MNEIEQLWEKFRARQIKPGVSPEDVIVLMRTYYSGAMDMFHLISIEQNLFYKELDREFQNFIEEITK